LIAVKERRLRLHDDLVATQTVSAIKRSVRPLAHLTRTNSNATVPTRAPQHSKTGAEKISVLNLQPLCARAVRLTLIKQPAALT
jgi:hypothetical protein